MQQTLNIATTDGGDHGSPTGTSEGSQPKILSTRAPNDFFQFGCDQDPSAVKPMPQFDPNKKILTTTREWGADYIEK